MRLIGICLTVVALVFGLLVSEAWGGPRPRGRGGARNGNGMNPAGVPRGVGGQRLPGGTQGLPGSTQGLPGGASAAAVPRPGSGARPPIQPGFRDPRAGGNRPATSPRTQLGNGPQPFTAEWYRAHPQAWRLKHPHADAFAVATWAAVTRWVGAPTTAAYGTSGGDVVVTGNEIVVDDSTVVVNDATPGGADETAVEGEWLPLGVFELAPEGDAHSAAQVELALHRDGRVQGNWFEAATDRSYLVSGRVDAETQVVALSTAAPGVLRLEMRLYDLTIEQSTALVTNSHGDVARWDLRRQPSPENAPSP